MIPCQQYGWHEEKYQVVMNPGFKRERPINANIRTYTHLISDRCSFLTKISSVNGIIAKPLIESVLVVGVVISVSPVFFG